MKIVYRDVEWRIDQPEENVPELSSIIRNMYYNDEGYSLDVENKMIETIIAGKYDLYLDENILEIEMDEGLGNLFINVEEMDTGFTKDEIL